MFTFVDAQNLLRELSSIQVHLGSVVFKITTFSYIDLQWMHLVSV